MDEAAVHKQQEKELKQQQVSERRLRVEKQRKENPGKVGWAIAEADGWMENEDFSLSCQESLLFREPKSSSPGRTRPRRRQNADHDYLNCGVPDSVRYDLNRCGVQLPIGTYEVEGVSMGAQLRQTKKAYNKLCKSAFTREDSKKCGSFADLTLPGSDRALRLQRLSVKNSFR